MNTVMMPASDPHAIERALDILNANGLVAFPTDTVYGVGALISSAQGIDRLFEAKIRSANKAVAVLVGDPAQLAQLTPGLTPSAERLALHFWPGALTLVVPRHPDLPENISPVPTVGVRMPDHPFALALMRQSGPLATSSANISGEANTLTAEQVYEQLQNRVDLILDGGPVPGGVPSTVVDCTSEQVTILRQGAIPDREIFRILGISQSKF